MEKSNGVEMKVVIVTGGNRGLGFAITKLLSSSGYRVVVVARKETEELRFLMNECAHVSFECYDFSILDGIGAFVRGLVSKYGRPYGLINNAAVGLDGVLATQHDSDICSVMTINAIAPIILTKFVSRSMMLNRVGRVINISSIIASTGFSGLSVYAASKSSMIGFTKSYAREMGKVGVTVNSVSPGYMQTDMTAGLTGAKLDSIRRRSPSGRLPDVADVANGVLFLLSEAASAINGTNLTIDEGSTA